ncbi:GNAT family N-acetyltransferase [Candidatus Latescibacterota bacterium]
MIDIRPEIPEDHDAVFEINSMAFETDAEAKLVDSVRAEGIALISLVAIFEGRIAGHILFTPVSIDNEHESESLMGIGPVAVLLEFQKRGIGSKLIREGLSVCENNGTSAVFVLGHVEYYPRFGFEPVAQHGLHYKESQYDQYFFVRELIPETLKNLSGSVHFHSLFDGV